MVQTIHVISHTHWDREWYRPFQLFRARLVDLVDALLDLMDTDPEYKFFHMDGQVAMLEDYLEIRPEQEPRLRRLIREGRILIGPWYTQPDEFLVSGEALVRNLLRGRRSARDYGGGMDLGYLPDTFGHTSQTPQILAGFGFPAAILFRGITEDQVPSAFTWRGADGTALLTIKLPDETAYSNFLYGLQSTLATEGPIDWTVADQQMVALRAECERLAVCDQLLWMDGVDHIFPNPKTPALIERANAIMPGVEVVHSTLPAYVQAVLDAAPDLKEQVGELRHANRAWRFQALLANVASSHIGIKQANYACQTLLEKSAEPLSALAWLHGHAYPRHYLDLAWKSLLQNHAHDSICGCSVDDVHRDMHYRYRQVAQVGETVQERGLQFLAEQVDTSFVKEGDGAFVVANPSPYVRTGTLVVDVPVQTDAAGAVLVYDGLGKVIEHQVLSITTRAPLYQSRFDVPHLRKRQIYRLSLRAVELAPYSLSAFGVCPVRGSQRSRGSLFVAPTTMENGYLRATVESDGSLTLEHKATGYVSRGLLTLEDSGDGGEGWNWIPPNLNEVIYSCAGPCDVARVQDGPLMAAMTVSLRFRIPRGMTPTPYEADQAIMQRSLETVELPVEITISLAAQSQRVDIAVKIDNRAENHRLRLLFPSNIPTDVCFADVAYDVIERRIALPDSHDWKEPQLGTCPHHSFVGVTDGRRGLAVFTAGTPEYEVIDDPQRTIAITLMRAFGRGAGEPHQYIDSQEQGLHRYRLALYPFAGSWMSGGVLREARLWGLSPLVWETPVHAGVLADRRSLLRVSGDGIDVTALKLCEARDSLLVRCVNQAAYRLTLAEERLDPLMPDLDGAIYIELAPKQIATVELVVGASHTGAP